MSDTARGDARPTVAALDAYRRYRLAVRRHDFGGEQKLKILDFVLCHSYGRHDGRPKAWAPARWCLAECCGMDRGDCSKALKWLEAQRVIEISECATDKCPFGIWLAILPPDTWRVPLNESSEAAAIEEWLASVDDPAHPEFWPPPQSLNDALREVFVENRAGLANQAAHAGRGPSRVEGRPVEHSSANGSQSVQGEFGPTRRSSPSQEVGKLPSAGHSGQGDRVGEFPSQSGVVRAPGVGNFPTSDPSSTRERGFPVPREHREQRELCSRETSTRSREGASKVSAEFRAYVETELFRLIGEHERRGACSQMWDRAVRDIPEDLNELIGQAKMLRSEGRIRVSVGAWLNRSVYKELQKVAEAR